MPEGDVYPLSIQTILIAHIMFNISFVVVTVRARLQGFPRHLEEAAMDLGANEWTTFWKVTFPLILPGVMAAALLAFSLSIDDYVITGFTSGHDADVPAVHLRLAAARHPGPGQRHRHHHLRGRRRPGPADHLVQRRVAARDLSQRAPPAAAPASGGRAP